jgi:hypothetical protein
MLFSSPIHLSVPAAAVTLHFARGSAASTAILGTTISSFVFCLQDPPWVVLPSPHPGQLWIAQRMVALPRPGAALWSPSPI